jgi:hypothetical protein
MEGEEEGSRMRRCERCGRFTISDRSAEILCAMCALRLANEPEPPPREHPLPPPDHQADEPKKK